MEQSTYYKSPMGVFKIVGNEKGIKKVNLVNDYPNPLPEIPELLTDCVQQLDEYFHRKRQHFKLNFDWSGASEFHISVWEELLKIPYGHTSSYSKIAQQIGKPKASQAIGLANKNNPIAIIVPCHRVIAKNGDLRGYFYGLDMKRKLLELENPMAYGEQKSLF